MKKLSSVLAIALLSLAPACGANEEIEDGESDSFSSGKADDLSEGSAEARGVLRLVNDAAVDQDELDYDAGLSKTVARRIIAKRAGLDAVAGTADDDLFETLAELDAVPYVGPRTLDALVAYARAKGYMTAGAKVDVVFSPQPAGATHTARVAQLIRSAQHSVDIAMYSYSDADVQTALVDAVARGVKVRFLFETAGTDKRVDLATRANTKSGRLERAGIDVRWVNKILHHKFAIIDGPRDVADRAATATIVTGSGNWSYGGASVYDENTLFISESPGMSTSYQREFDLLWSHSGDFALEAPLPYELSTATLATDAADEGADALFTTANFTVADGSTTFRVDKTSYKVAEQWVSAIAGARESIYVAHGHLRLRAVAEALIAAKAANPDLDIKVLLDQQEFISTTGHSAQVAEVDECLAAAGADEAERHDCLDSNFLFSKQLADAGVDLRFKSYSYRWDHSYALQMHHKYMVVDGQELFTGSYNWSTNAEQGTFENVVRLRGEAYAGTLEAFTGNFLGMWDNGRADDALAKLRNTITTASSIPLVFAPIALTWREYSDLRTLIRQNCTLADSTDYRSNPGAHRVCPR